MNELDKARLDAYLTREPPEVPEEPGERRCSNCGTVLNEAPEKVETWEDAYTCSGQVLLATQTYDAEHDKGVLDIIGWDHLGENFEVVAPAACGDDVGHEPHRVVVADGITEHRVCPMCRVVNTETLM